MGSRIIWDKRFLQLAEFVAGWSKDPSTKVGAVITDSTNTAIGLGYNGFPRGMSDEPELYNDRDEKYARIVHAEINAIINARAPVKGATLYTWPFLTCERCAVIVIQAGIARVVAPGDYPERWRKSITKAISFFSEAGVEVALQY